LRLTLDYLEKSKIINVAEAVQDKAMMNKLVQEIAKMDTENMV
jgi:hypothetical protein